MRYGIFSDVHSNLEALEAVINACKRESIDKYLCVGDVVGYAANPKECIDRILDIAEATVAGNHDWASVDLFSIGYFNPVAKEAISWTKQHLENKHRDFLLSLRLVYGNYDLTMVHGTLNCPQDFYYMTDDYLASKTFGLLKTKICFVGHTHVAGVFVQEENNRLHYRNEHSCEIKIEESSRYIINVGSIGQPRNGSPSATYCIYDTDKEIARIKRVDYDIQKARNKIITSGLPVFLGDRLLSGM